MASQLALLGGEPLRKRPFTRWPLFDDRERAQLEDVLSSTTWGGHPSPNRKASELAGRFAAFQGVRYAIPASSGTSALEVAIKALGIGPGDEVIVPAITFAATAYAAVAALARPVFADVDAATACIDPHRAEQLITSRTKAIIPVHYGATLADLDALSEIGRKHSIAIVEDCAHVPGARWRERGAGAWGNLGCFSFQTSKPMTAGEGGMIATDDPELEQRCQSLINCGRRRPADTFNAPLLGANYRMTEWQCGVLLAQLDRLPEQRVTREVIVLFLFQVDEARLGVSRNRFLRALRAEGIPCGVANQPVYRSDLFPMASSPYRTACRLGAGEAAVPHECPNAE